MLPPLCLLKGTVGAPLVRFLFSPPAFSFALSSLNYKPLSLLSSTFSPLPAEKRHAQHCDGGASHAEPCGQAGLWQSRLMELWKPVVSLSASTEVSFRRKEGPLHFPFVDFFLSLKKSQFDLSRSSCTLGRAKAMDLHYPLYLCCKYSHGRWGHSPPSSWTIAIPDPPAISWKSPH